MNKFYSKSCHFKVNRSIFLHFLKNDSPGKSLNIAFCGKLRQYCIILLIGCFVESWNVHSTSFYAMLIYLSLQQLVDFLKMPRMSVMKSLTPRWITPLTNFPKWCLASHPFWEFGQWKSQQLALWLTPVTFSSKTHPSMASQHNTNSCLKTHSIVLHYF